MSSGGERRIEEVVVVEGDARGGDVSAVPGEREDVAGHVDAVQRVLDSPQESTLEFGEQEGELVGGGVAVVVRHELVEAGHQTLDVDEPVAVAVALGFEHPARERQAADGVYQIVVVEVVDQQGSGLDEGARGPGAGHVHMVRRIRWGHKPAAREAGASAAVGRAAASLLSFPIPSVRMGGGFADGLDSPPGPAVPVLALAALEIRGYALVHDAGTDQKSIPEGRGCWRGGDHAREYRDFRQRGQFGMR